MPVKAKTAEEIAEMRKAGKIVSEVLMRLEDFIRPGVTTKQVNHFVYEFLKKNGAEPSLLGYMGFPATVCASVDEEVVHGIPSAKRVVEEGSLLKVDVTASVNGYHADAARTYAVGKVSEEKARLMRVCKESFFEGMKVVKVGATLGDLGSAIQTYVERNGYSVVRSLVGHGIGNSVHEDPNVPNYGVKGRGLKLIENMTIAVEPMINLGRKEVDMLSDGWTIVTADRTPSAHYENTIVVTENGAEILTL